MSKERAEEKVTKEQVVVGGDEKGLKKELLGPQELRPTGMSDNLSNRLLGIFRLAMVDLGAKMTVSLQEKAK